MKKILVCEDESAIRDFVVINLTRAGYDVVEADCGEAALKKYEENDGDFDTTATAASASSCSRQRHRRWTR